MLKLRFLSPCNSEKDFDTSQYLLFYISVMEYFKTQKREKGLMQNGYKYTLIEKQVQKYFEMS